MCCAGQIRIEESKEIEWDSLIWIKRGEVGDNDSSIRVIGIRVDQCTLEGRQLRTIAWQIQRIHLWEEIRRPLNCSIHKLNHEQSILVTFITIQIAPQFQLYKQVVN